MQAVGVRSLDWLIAQQTTADGYFAPIGSNGFYPRRGVKAQFDQQPVDAAATVSACLDARRITGVTFPCGYTIGADGDTRNVYRGAADTSMALATGSIAHLLRWLDAQPPMREDR